MPERWATSHICSDYEVSDQGRVRRLASGRGAVVGRILSTGPDDGGYPCVNVCGKPHRVHVLVADAFLGPLAAGTEVHHLNEDRGDPRLSNLEPLPSKLAHGERHRRRASGRRRHGEPNLTIFCACGCGSTFSKFDRTGRPRRFLSGHNHEARQMRKEVVGDRG